ncbi:40S ribosomal protein S6-like [Onychomys torridus]|uniref:40S ribosomal protein S6-like n=1 Tax=Onychomys torridus TaxID=38674 RepID=UPI00167FB770|nr:40S ribosomal protein S6-like [Onychomys torridus]
MKDTYYCWKATGTRGKRGGQVVGCVKMKLNISFPVTGCQKFVEVDEEQKISMFCEKHLATEVAADSLGKEWKGYVVRINGRNETRFSHKGRFPDPRQSAPAVK